jgi:hypothetical protein
MRYLELVINEDGEESLHESLVKCYVDIISAAVGDCEAARISMNSFIRNDSTRLDLNTVLGYFDSDGIFVCLIGDCRIYLGTMCHLWKTWKTQ